MAKKTLPQFGIEYDQCGIRGARVVMERVGDDELRVLDTVEEITGDFSTGEELLAGLKQLREKLAAAAGGFLATCIGGKEVYAARLAFRRLPDNEMANALRLEMRKSLPFELSSSTMDFQIMDSGERKDDKVDVLVAVVADALMSRHLKVLEKAGLKPEIVDVLPTAIANALNISLGDEAEEGIAHLALHIGPSMSTVVFDGAGVPFFTRSIYFDAQRIFNGKEKAERMSERERSSKTETFLGEITRSLSFYEHTYKVSRFGRMALMGDFSDRADLRMMIAERAGLQPLTSSPASRMGAAGMAPPGKLDLAVALASRGSTLA